MNFDDLSNSIRQTISDYATFSEAIIDQILEEQARDLRNKAISMILLPGPSYTLEFRQARIEQIWAAMKRSRLNR